MNDTIRRHFYAPTPSEPLGGPDIQPCRGNALRLRSSSHIRRGTVSAVIFRPQEHAVHRRIRVSVGSSRSFHRGIHTRQIPPPLRTSQRHSVRSRTICSPVGSRTVRCRSSRGDTKTAPVCSSRSSRRRYGSELKASKGADVTSEIARGIGHELEFDVVVAYIAVLGDMSAGSGYLVARAV